VALFVTSTMKIENYAWFTWAVHIIICQGGVLTTSHIHIFHVYSKIDCVNTLIFHHPHLSCLQQNWLCEYSNLPKYVFYQPIQLYYVWPECPSAVSRERKLEREAQREPSSLENSNPFSRHESQRTKERTSRSPAFILWSSNY